MNQMGFPAAAPGVSGEGVTGVPERRMKFVNGTVLTGVGALDGANIDIVDGRIAAIEPAGGAVDGIDLAGGWLVPGFVDLQVNGGGGVLFNDAPDVEAIRRIGAAHARFGTTGFMPTLISATPDQILLALDAVDRAVDQGVPGCIGLHVEGPAINGRRRGIHAAERLRMLDADVIARLVEPRRAKVMVTLAPEFTGLDDVRRLAESGVVVSLGHSDCDYDTARAAIAAGARGVTHLFNAMSAMHHRAPGLVGAVLEDRSIWSSIIVDGEHLHPAAVRIAVATRPADKLFLVTDAMPCVGTDIDAFELEGRPIRVVDGRCLGEDGTLAGAALDMAAAVRNTIAQTGIDVAAAVALAAANPAAYVGLQDERGRIAEGLSADFVQLDAHLQPVCTWMRGIPSG